MPKSSDSTLGIWQPAPRVVLEQSLLQQPRFWDGHSAPPSSAVLWGVLLNSSGPIFDDVCLASALLAAGVLSYHPLFFCFLAAPEPGRGSAQLPSCGGAAPSLRPRFILQTFCLFSHLSFNQSESWWLQFLTMYTFNRHSILCNCML